MSNLYRSAMSARLAKLPPDLPQTSDDGEEEEEELDSVGALPGSGLGPPAMPARHPRTKPKREPNPAFAPISAEGLFDSAAQVQVEARGLDVRVYYTPPKFADGTVMVCHHGAGYSGLSFACFAKEIADMTRGECGVLAFDARRHGKTTASSDDENLSIDVLVDDLYELVRTTFQTPKDAPTLVLIGHSMGGSVITRACPKLQDGGYRVTGVTVIDVVEGSAIDALPHMHSLLNARPDGFDSLEEAIEWHVTTNTIRNVRSARISIPSIFKASEPKSPLVPAYVWRTPLRSTAPYWTSWFKGLSSTFLAARTARLLVLAGHDRLDKELMIGQMQGKFQLMVIPGVGHMVQEDDPTRLAEIVVEFWRRNERVVAGVKRVGEN
ncbi:carboxyl methyl esterase activity protein [Pleurotus ostreatus]|uniref:Protein phosphatase methylesterase 1 n=1 Tax=Pleurotus ostreatus TaxID=5322 RepID=A0A8H6ZMR1_PLEOS|nr:carboxyl methyl esterase activity protein [Pleurotus ostreatus]KAF7424568.1 carboxyl methyl esterase activity protein [Pleurotus ostreatus]KAJ8692471.1 Protein phosphatase methylesterase 1 [Pleurotus ostreatus]